ncbi:MAG TPA: RpoL/Rpb11 RNA polymerase subunit family protein [Nitrososphaeraceae archaeon]
MLLELEENDDRTIDLKIKEEDISVLYIVQHELLKHKNIEFAGVVLKHQLIKDYVLRVISKGSSAMDTLHKSIESSTKNVENLEQLMNSAFASEGVKKTG